MDWLASMIRYRFQVKFTLIFEVIVNTKAFNKEATADLVLLLLTVAILFSCHEKTTGRYDKLAWDLPGPLLTSKVSENPLSFS